MRSYVCAVPVKLLALACTLTGVFMTAGIVCPFLLVILALLFLAAQRKWRLVCLYGIFYLLLSLILYGIRFYGLHLLVFSEFYVLMLWNLSPVFLISWDLITTPPGDLSAFLAKIHAPISFILGSLVVFRFFPTMRVALIGIWRSMKNRGLTDIQCILLHPLRTCEYVLTPLMLRCLQIADQLAISAVARGAECPGARESYYGSSFVILDWMWSVVWVAGTVLFLFADALL